MGNKFLPTFVTDDAGLFHVSDAIGLVVVWDKILFARRPEAKARAIWHQVRSYPWLTLGEFVR